MGGNAIELAQPRQVHCNVQHSMKEEGDKTKLICRVVSIRGKVSPSDRELASGPRAAVYIPWMAKAAAETIQEIRPNPCKSEPRTRTGLVMQEFGTAKLGQDLKKEVGTSL